MKKFTTFLLQQKIGKVCNDFYVNTYYLLEELKPYEVNLNQLCKKYKITIPKELKNTNKDSFWVNINTELITLLEENNIFEEVKIDNTYNMSGKINHDICFVIYKNKKNDKYYIEISVHLEGDIRGNYTDSVVYEFEYETEIYDFLLENSKKYYISYKGIEYGIEVNAIKENVEVFGGKYGELDIMSKYDICRENVKQYIQEYIDKRNSLLKVGTEIEIFDMKDKEKLENVYYDKSYQDIVIYRVEKIIRDILVVSSKDNPIIKVRIRKNDLFKIEEGVIMTYEDLLEKNCNSLEELIEFVDIMLSLYYEISEFEGITTVDVYCLDDNMSSDLIVSYEFKEGKPINRI